MAAIKITTNFNIDLEFTPAPFHRRLFAWMLDIIVIFFYIYFAIKCIEWIAESRIFRNENSSEGIWAIMMVLMLPILTYHLIMEVMLKGQSVGKRIMGLRVISENGGKPSISQYIIRWLIRTSDYMIVIIALNAPTGFGSGASFIWQIGAAFGLLMTDIILVNSSQKSQRLGDMLAHTILIRTKENARIEDTIFLQVQENYVPSFPQVMQLSDRDINALKGILDTAKKQSDYHLAERAAEKIKGHLKIDTSMSAFDFLEILLKDYNYLSAN
jgi:uncharacterized RDD family membrane protein YckC